MNTIELYQTAIKSALTVRKIIEEINKNYEHECKIVREEFEADLLGEAGYKMKLSELEQIRDSKIAREQDSINEISREYTAEMEEAAKLDGSRIDEGTLKLLDSGLRLTNQDWQELADAFKDNYIMTRILKERYKNRPQVEKNNLTLEKPNDDLEFVRFGQSPQDKAKNFNQFINFLSSSVTRDSMPSAYNNMSYVSKQDFWNSAAKESINHMQPLEGESFDNLEQDFPVNLVKTKPVIW